MKVHRLILVDSQLIQFRVENHRSLRDPQVLSFVASAPGDPRLLRPTGFEEALVPVAAIYGANGSGKSNVLQALAFMAQAVVFSQRLWEPDGGVSRFPFALDSRRSSPSVYAVQMLIDGVRYEYGFAVNDSEVIEEWLSAWPSGRKQELFSRDGQEFDFGRHLPGENKAIESLTRPNSLFLSAAAQNNHEHLAPIFQWFSNRLFLESFSNSPPDVGWRRFEFGFSRSQISNWWSQFKGASNEAEHFERRDRVRALLSSADLGIEDFRVEEEEIPTPNSSEGRTRVRVRRRITFAHKSQEASSEAWFALDQESTGTQSIVRIIPDLVQVLEGGGLLVIDELNSLHPMLALAIVKLFQDPAKNVRGAQLLFNTHEATLLGTLVSDPPPLRRDQVWLTEKDQEGASHLYPLTDYRPRSVENLERGYFQGRYGAVPFVGALDWSVPSKRSAKG